MYGSFPISSKVSGSSYLIHRSNLDKSPPHLLSNCTIISFELYCQKRITMYKTLYMHSEFLLGGIITEKNTEPYSVTNEEYFRCIDYKYVLGLGHQSMINICLLCKKHFNI